jgi:photosystem II stability/assembly factor-like uncharacterized protein
MSIYLQPNTSTNGIYTGSCYAFGASGGFTVQQGVDQITLRPPDILEKYDVTDAIQVTFSARRLNEKISIIKDVSNINTIQAWFDPITDTLHYDSLNLCACDFKDGVNTESVISIGKLSTIYTDFQTCVASYFGDPAGFASLFVDDYNLQINGGIFDASAYVQVINSSKFNMQGSFVSDLSGYVIVSDINKLLRYVVDTNIFNNRNPTEHNYGIPDGFVAGDLIFIPEGFTISLSVDIEAEPYLPINNVGPSYLNSIRNRLNWTRGYVKRTTTATTTNITQTTTVPLLLILSDETLENHANYGKYWFITPVADGSGNPLFNNTSGEIALAISLSSTGQYQSMIMNTGKIYRTLDYGTTWELVNNIGVSAANSIALSFTGMHQTCSNGHSIYVSDDYGATWRQTYTSGTSNILVSISLNGKYQTLISSGDNVYKSDDYGNTWRPLDTNTDLYQSVEIFPTGGVALSYSGQYQTIVVENIYVSDDFGTTWANVSDSNGFEDRNWQGVAMSSDGKYQTAIESGGEIHISSNYGKSWLFVDDARLIDKVWQSVSCSATGKYQTVLEQNGNVYTSNDYGATWNAADDPLVTSRYWQAVSVSSDGLLQAAIDTQGTIYTSSVFGTGEDPSKICHC